MSQHYQAPLLSQSDAMSPLSFGQMTRSWNQAQGSVSELCPWLFGLPPGLVCNKDSGLLAVFELTGLDVDSSTNNAINKLSINLQDAVGQLMASPVYMWFQARRLLSTAWPTAEFPEPVSASLDAMRQASFINNPQYTNKHYLIILMQPPKGLDNIAAKLAAMTKDHGDNRSAFSRLIMSIVDVTKGDKTRSFQYSSAELASSIDEFERLLTMFSGSVQGLSMRRLFDDELGGYLASTTSCLDDSFKPRSIVPAYGKSGQSADDVQRGAGLGIARFLDTRLPAARIETMPNHGDGRTLHLQAGSGESRFARVVSVTDFPSTDATFPTQLDNLLYVPGELVLNVVFQCMPKSLGLKVADNARRYHGNRKLSLKQLMRAATENGDTSGLRQNSARANAEEDAAMVHDQISMGRDLIGMVYINVLAVGETPEQSLAVSQMVGDEFTNAKYGYKLEGVHALSAWSATLPGMYGNIIRWIPVTVANVADIAPVRTVAMGHYDSAWMSDQTGSAKPAACVFATDVGTPYWFDFFANGAGHVFLVGPPGAGKSVMGGFLMSMLRRYKGAQAIVLDKDLSQRMAILMQGGVYADLSPDSKDRLTVNPLALLTDKRHLPWVSEWVVLLLTQDGTVISADDKLLLQKGLTQLSESVGANGQTETATLSRLFALLPASSVKNLLRQWVRTEKGLMASFFDNAIDAFDVADMQGFEMGSILNSPSLAVPFTEYLFYRIEQHLKARRESGNVAPTAIYLSEVWHLLSNPVYEHKIVDWLKTLRKFTGVVFMDTQSLDELAQSKAFSALLDNIPNKFFLPNQNADTKGSIGLYTDKFGLSVEQVTRIANARRKQDYFLLQGDVARMLQLVFSDDELAILRSDNRAQAAMDKALRSKAQGNTAWRDVYLEGLKNANSN